MTTRFKLGLFDDSEFETISYDLVSSKEHKRYSQECAEKSIVLLKNNGILPINHDNIKSIGVIGQSAACIDALRGIYYDTGDEYTTFLKGIQERFDGRVYYAEGSHLFKDSLQPLGEYGDGYAEAKAVATHSDLVVLCVGLDATIEGEEGDTGNAFAAGDKNDLFLPKVQQELVDIVLSLNKPTVIVISAGSAINPKGERADAILHAWYPGQMGGKALATFLFGSVSPSGKLPVTFYEDVKLLPDFEDYKMINRTYRYAENNVLYPFGYGLTYSKVNINELSYDSKTDLASLWIENLGEYDTDEVIQLYMKDLESNNAVRNYTLCGFKRVHVKRSEKIKIELKVPRSAFEVVDEKGDRKVQSNKFRLFAGISQPDELSQELTGIPVSSIEIVLK